MLPEHQSTPTPEAPARWAAIALDLMRQVHRRGAEYRACAELLGLAIERLREQDREIDKLRERHHRAIDENRMLRAQLAACRRRAA